MDSGLDSESALLEGEKWGFCPGSSGVASPDASASKQCSVVVRRKPLLASLRLPQLLLRHQLIPEDRYAFIAKGTHRDMHTTIAVSPSHICL